MRYLKCDCCKALEISTIHAIWTVPKMTSVGNLSASRYIFMMRVLVCYSKVGGKGAYCMCALHVFSWPSKLLNLLWYTSRYVTIRAAQIRNNHFLVLPFLLLIFFFLVSIKRNLFKNGTYKEHPVSKWLPIAKFKIQTIVKENFSWEAIKKRNAQSSRDCL